MKCFRTNLLEKISFSTLLRRQIYAMARKIQTGELFTPYRFECVMLIVVSHKKTDDFERKV